MNCSKSGCTCAATKKPVLSFASKLKPRGMRATAALGLAVCDEHAIADPSHWVGDEGWAQICAALRAAGKAAPARDTLQVSFVALN